MTKVGGHAEHQRLKEGDLVQDAKGEVFKVHKYRDETWLLTFTDENAPWLSDDGVETHGCDEVAFPLTVVRAVPARE